MAAIVIDDHVEQTISDTKRDCALWRLLLGCYSSFSMALFVSRTPFNSIERSQLTLTTTGIPRMCTPTRDLSERISRNCRLDCQHSLDDRARQEP